MKKALFVVLVLFVTVALFGQTGYKDYTWGMSLEQVKEKCPDVREVGTGFKATLFMFYYVYYEQLDSFPDPLKQETRNMTKFQSMKNDLMFYFIDNKLVAVDVTFSAENILPELLKQNGNKIARSIRYSENTYKLVAWNNNQNRYILYDFDNYFIETVTYIDGRWLKPLFDKTMTAINAAKSSSKSKLD